MGVNDVLTVHPEWASEWEPDLNDGLLLHQIHVGSQTPLNWRCERGHDYRKPPAARVKTGGCYYCSGKKQLPGLNDWTIKFPILMSEWHPTKNDVPANEVVGIRTSRWWKCRAAGHEQLQRLYNRLSARGCSQCPPSERILFGLAYPEIREPLTHG